MTRGRDGSGAEVSEFLYDILSIFLIGVCLYSVYGNTFGLFVETLAEFYSCAFEISAFFATLYAFCVTREHDIFEIYMDKSRILYLLKWCML